MRDLDPSSPAEPSRDPWRQAVAWHTAGLKVAIARVVDTWGSAPNRAGACLAANDTGDFVGSVSGGCVEASVLRAAREVMRTGDPLTMTYRVTDSEAGAVGLACGGELRVRVERLDETAPAPRSMRRDLLDQLLADRAAHRSVALVTPLARGASVLAYPQPTLAAMESQCSRLGLGGEPSLVRVLEESLQSGDARTVRGERQEFLVHPFTPPLRVVVVGAVHIAEALVRLATVLAFRVIVIEPRRAFADRAAFAATERIDAWPDEGVSRLAPDRRTAVVTLTHDSKLDDAALSAALRTEAFYIGALGSRKTHRARCRRLAEAGFTPPQIDRVRGPVGLPIGGKTPEEVALSILAEVVACVRKPSAAGSVRAPQIGRLDDGPVP